MVFWRLIVEYIFGADSSIGVIMYLYEPHAFPIALKIATTTMNESN